MGASISRRVAAMLAWAALLLTVTSPPAGADPTWQPAQAALTTPWTALVGPGNALPQYPRPQMARPNWQNLNGVWSYRGRPAALLPAASAPPQTYPERILVPFPAESALSGIGRHDDEMWYHRTFRVDGDWNGRRVLLHFGAVDQIATVWVNGHRVARHEGGYTAFSADITDSLRPGRLQEIVVRAEDRNEANPFPVGKQRNRPEGLFYTGASGIWQTVWLEQVPTAHIDKLDIATDLRAITVTPRTRGTSDERVIVFVTKSGGGLAAVATGAPGEGLRIPIPDPQLWTPDRPYLYSMAVALVRPSGQVVDAVSSYAGLRTIGVVKDARGHHRIALNGTITFLHGPLDQGYWPDGIYTAPTDDALKSDLQWTKDLGMNFVRKHAKVEPARWYHWADKLGLLVWQDMPSLDVSLRIPVGPAPEPVKAAKANFERELFAMIDQLRSVTSIVGWVPFNEGWGEFDTARIAQAVKDADPTRLVNANSGVNCCKSRGDTGAGDIYDDHTYVGPGIPTASLPGVLLTATGSGVGSVDSRARVDGEYGGLGLAVDVNRWPGQPLSYEMTDGPARLTQRYVEVSYLLEDIVRSGQLSGAVYTQTTDVENEVNGFLTYDRRQLKMPLDLVAQRNRTVIAAGSDPG